MSRTFHVAVGKTAILRHPASAVFGPKYLFPGINYITGATVNQVKCCAFEHSSPRSIPTTYEASTIAFIADTIVSAQVVLPSDMVDNSNSLCTSPLGWVFRHGAVRTGYLFPK